jgi:hypothetical protein
MAKKTETRAKTGKAATTKPAPKNAKAKTKAKASAASSTPGKETQDPAMATEPTTEEKQDETTAASESTKTQPPDAPATPTTTLAAQASSGSADTRLPAKGTVLQKRDRQGAVRCECVIVDGGVRYSETVYRSLSAAAVAAAKDLGLAAKAMNGFTFWGLTKAARKEADPVAVLERVWTRYWSHLESTLEQAKAGGEHREPMLTTIQRHARVLQNLHDEVA